MDNRENKIKLVTEAIKQLKKQGRLCRAVRNGKVKCLYRDGDAMCAFGPAIRDYDPEMEDRDARSLLHQYSDELHPWAREIDDGFADRVRECHDSAADVGDAVNKLELLLEEICGGPQQTSRHLFKRGLYSPMKKKYILLGYWDSTGQVASFEAVAEFATDALKQIAGRMLDDGEDDPEDFRVVDMISGEPCFEVITESVASLADFLEE